MSIYLLILGITIILSFIEMRITNNEKKILLYISRGVLPCVFLCCMVGMRDLKVGADNYNYSRFFTRMTFEKIHLFDPNYSWGYNLWVFAIRQVTGNVFIFNICCAVVIYFALYKFIHKYSTDERVSVILFVTLGVFFNSMNQTRQALATAIVLLAFKYALEKDLIKSLLMCAAAVFVHNVAIVIIPIYVLICLLPQIGPKVVMIFSGVFLSIALLYNKLIELFVFIFPRYKRYLRFAKLFVEKRSIYRYGDFFLALAIQAILLYGVYRRQRGSTNSYEENDFGNVLACMNAVYLCMTYLILNGDIFNRLKSLFIYWLIITIPYIISKFFNDSKIIKLLVCTISLAYMWRLGVHDGDGVIPYKFFFDSNIFF